MYLFSRRDSLGLDACNSDFEEVECLLPNGILMSISVHPDDELGQIKQLVLVRAISDGRVPSIHRDVYYVVYISMPQSQIISKSADLGAQGTMYSAFVISLEKD
jgi:hypothetical protein